MFAETMHWPDKHTEPYRTGIHMEGTALRLADAIFSSSDCSADWCARSYGRIPAPAPRLLEARPSLSVIIRCRPDSQPHLCQAIGGSRDRKMESFMEAAGMRDWVIGVKEIGSLPERLAELEAQKSADDFGEQSRRRNRQAAEQLRG